MAGGAMSLAAIGVGTSLMMLSKDGSIAILSCEETMDMLPAYADGSLVAVADRKAVEKHLKHCHKLVQPLVFHYRMGVL